MAANAFHVLNDFLPSSGSKHNGKSQGLKKGTNQSYLMYVYDGSMTLVLLYKANNYILVICATFEPLCPSNSLHLGPEEGGGL